MTTLRDASGQPFAPAQPRSRGPRADQARHARDHLGGLREPADRPVGARVRPRRAPAARVPVPAAFLPVADGSRGVRQNLGFESAGVTPSGRYLFTGTEAAVVQDGPPSTLAAGSPARLLRYDLERGTLDRQFVYWTDPIASRPCRRRSSRSAASSSCCRSNKDSLLSMERSFSVGAPGHRQHDQALQRLAAARGRRQRLRQPRHAAGERAPRREDAVARSRRARDPARQRRRDGVREEAARRPPLLILVSDNNFSPTAFTQFLLFAVSKRGGRRVAAASL